MSLKKYLERLECGQRGQVFLEYIMLLVVLAALTIAASSDFFRGFRDRINRFQARAVTSMGSANAMSEEPEPEPEDGSGTSVIDFSGGW